MGKNLQSRQGKPGNGLFFLCLFATVLVLIVVLLCPVVQITGQNIAPSLATGDTVVLFPKQAYKAGECAVFETDEKYIVTYVLGAPGDVVIATDDGKAIVNNMVLDGTFQFGASYDGTTYAYPYTVPEGYYFTVATLVDARAQSVPAVGLIAQEQMVGKVAACVWPLTHIGLGDHLGEVDA